MKRILLLFLPFLPYLASAQVAKDTVTVLTLAQIPAGAIRDTTNITFVQDNGFKKARFDSLARYVTSKLIGDRGDITVSGATGLTWELDAGVVDSMQLSAGAVVLPGAKVTGTLPVGKGGTGQGTLTANKVLVGNGTSGVLAPSELTYSATDPKLAVNGWIKTTAISVNSNRGGLADGGLFFNRSSGDPFFAWFSDDKAITQIRGSRSGGDAFLYISDTTGFGDKYFTVRTLGTNVGNVGIGTDNPAYRLDVNGNVRADTYYYDVGSALVSSSDANFKKNILPLPSMLQKINALQPVEFEWNDLKLDQMQGRDNLHKMLGKNIGLIAQDVYNVFPEFTGEDAEGNMTVSYISLIVPMLKAIQEQQQQIEALKARITQLENK